jgi:hypothetical protein
MDDFERGTRVAWVCASLRICISCYLTVYYLKDHDASPSLCLLISALFPFKELWGCQYRMLEGQFDFSQVLDPKATCISS